MASDFITGKARFYFLKSCFSVGLLDTETNGRQERRCKKQAALYSRVV